MRPRLVAAVLARNEADPSRYLRPVMARLQMLCDEIVVLDDASTDDTVEICKGFGAFVEVRDPHIPRAWGAEATARLRLWQLVTEHCGPKDWALFADCDMILHGDPRPLLATRELNSWAFPLYDLWSDTHYRSDQFWQGHNVPRVWLVAPHRVPGGWVPLWNRSGLHVGHLPQNWPAVAGIAPPGVYYLHYAYKDPRHREAKARQYLEKSDLLSDWERAHAASILTPP